MTNEEIEAALADDELTAIEVEDSQPAREVVFLGDQSGFATY